MKRRGFGINYNPHHTKAWEKPRHWFNSVNNIYLLEALNVDQKQPSRASLNIFKKPRKYL